MQDLIWLVPLGVAVGAYGTLIGAGGGFVLMPLLLLIYPDQPAEVLAAISLAVVFFNAASGSAAYARMRRIDYRAAVLFAAAGVPGAAAGAYVTAWVPRGAFNFAVAAALMAGAAFLTLRPPRAFPLPARDAPAAATDPSAHLGRSAYALGMGLSVGVGFLSSLLGIGGGIIHVPLLVYVLHFPTHVATATSHLILAIMALAATVVHLAGGSLAHGALRTAGLSIGVIGGAQIGAWLSGRLGGKWILRGLAFALAVVGVRLLIMAI